MDHHPPSGKRTSRRTPVILTPAEVEALVATVNPASTTGLRNRTMLQAMLGAGLRVSELVGLRGADVDLQKGTVRVNQHEGPRDRLVPVDHETLHWLQAWATKRRELGFSPKEAFFVGLRKGATGRGKREQGQGLTTRYVQGLVSTLAEAARIEKRVSPHALRHTCAARRLDQGFSVREVQTLLGHSSIHTTEAYACVDPEALRARVQAQPKPAVDPQVQALAAALEGLTSEQRHAVRALLEAMP